jgi:hypothetical protein
MKSIRWVTMTALLLLSTLVLASGCITLGHVKDNGGENGSAPPAETTVYLKNNIHVYVQTSRRGEKVYRASYANYDEPGPGHEIIPVNTLVTLKTAGSFRGKEIRITTADGKLIHFEFNSRNMGMSPTDYFPLISSPEKTSLERFSPLERKGIKEGKAFVGMSKDAVRIALGYPAVHRTPSLDSDTWYYWRDRWRPPMAVIFNKHGRVAEIR